ncbi:MAG: pyruvate kinase [Nitrospirota bacterium]
MVKTKIICTIGPSSDSVTVLRNMMLAGMDVARLNFSHGIHIQHKHRIKLIRQLNKEYRRDLKILQDLEGYRIRIGRLKGKKEIELKKKQIICLSNQKILDHDVIPFDYEGDLRDIKNGSYIYIDDGNIALLVKTRTRDYIKAEVVIPGPLKENKGVNIPDVNLKFKGLSDKDKCDIEFGLRNKVDYIAQSFVRDKYDIMLIRDLVKTRLPDCQIIAKIENRQGIKNIDEIIKVSDGVMVARGDMGVSLPLYEIPIIQKEIIKKCNQAGKFVIVATQMLESMVENIRPTRAEVTDVANAVLDGANSVMLSAETAVGRYPVEAVKMMNQVIKFTEKYRK